jgi:hypothetical protein
MLRSLQARKKVMKKTRMIVLLFGVWGGGCRAPHARSAGVQGKGDSAGELAAIEQAVTAAFLASGEADLDQSDPLSVPATVERNYDSQSNRGGEQEVIIYDLSYHGAKLYVVNNDGPVEFTLFDAGGQQLALGRGDPSAPSSNVITWQGAAAKYECTTDPSAPWCPPDDNKFGFHAELRSVQNGAYGPCVVADVCLNSSVKISDAGVSD